MKKVWILEKFATAEEMAKSYSDMQEFLEQAKAEGKEKEAQAFESALANYKNLMEQFPEGRWYGFEGKTIYNQFVRCAKDALNRWPEGTFRVIEGEIADDAKYWTGYKFVKVNDGVYRYLMATK